MNEDNFTGYNSKLLQASRELRKQMTKQERHLWYDFLHDYPVRVYRQRSIDHYIADFYCSRAHLVIELDGYHHYTPEGIEYDSWRTKVLEQYKLTVIRISNADIDRNFDATCMYIDEKIQQEVLKWEGK